MIYDIVHRTEYRFHRPVELGWHKLTFRPRDGHDMRVLATSLDVTPAEQQVHLVHDVYDNSVALILPGGPADHLRIESRFTVEHTGSHAFHLSAPQGAQPFPPAYTDAEQLALHPFLLPSFDDATGRVLQWARRFVGADGAAADSRVCIAAMTEFIRAGFTYESRDSEGVQTPAQTLERGAGACRDYATLMIDALRRLGIAARFVSGYLFEHAQTNGDPGGGPVGNQGGGATHAWVQCYLPERGWFPCDPTNNLIGGSDLIRIAVARQASEVSPLSGEWFGDEDDFAGMAVQVTVSARHRFAGALASAA